MCQEWAVSLSSSGSGWTQSTAKGDARRRARRTSHRSFQRKSTSNTNTWRWCLKTCDILPEVAKILKWLQVWGVGDEPVADSDEEGGPSALDMDPEAQAVMEMMGKTFVSKTVKAEDEQREKEKRDEERASQQWVAFSSPHLPSTRNATWSI